MIAISSAIARASQTVARKVWAPKSKRRRALRAEAPELFPASRSVDAVRTFYAAFGSGLFSVALLALLCSLATVATLVTLGVDQDTVDTIGRWLWAIFMSPLLYGGYAAVLSEIAERPAWWRFVPRPLRTPSDLHLLAIPIMGVTLFYAVNPFLGVPK